MKGTTIEDHGPSAAAATNLRKQQAQCLKAKDQSLLTQAGITTSREVIQLLNETR